MKKVGIIMGSDSDLPVIRKATDMLDSLGFPMKPMYTQHTVHRSRRGTSRSARGKTDSVC